MDDAYCLLHGDCRERLQSLHDNSIDAIVTDPPYGLSFMGKKWDYDVPSADIWRECLRVLKPGGHLLAFAGTRTQHRMACNIEDAGFDIRDMIAWVYGSGFPKSLDVSKAIDRMDATEEQEARRLRFTAWVRLTGLTARQIDDATGTNMGGHYTTAASQPAIMTREHLEAVRHMVAEVPEWVERECDIRSVESRNMAAREVVGQSTNQVGVGWVESGEAGYKPEFNITAPATDAARQWDGWGTALKPAMEPITVARKPLCGTVAENVLRHGTGGINVDACRVASSDQIAAVTGKATLCGTRDGYDRPWKHDPAALAARQERANAAIEKANTLGRWPANVIHDGSDEVVGLFPVTTPSPKGIITQGGRAGGGFDVGSGDGTRNGKFQGHGDSGSAARFFYCAKASKRDRDEGCEGMEQRKVSTMNSYVRPSEGRTADKDGGPKRNYHPTVKPTDLMRYLCRLVTPPGGTVLDPFMGSGSTGKAAMLEGFRFIGIERESEYVEIARRRIEAERIKSVHGTK